MASNEIQVYLCPHCGNKASIKRISGITQQAEFEEGVPMDYYYSLYQCMSCENALLFESAEWMDNPGDVQEGRLVYPSTKKIPAFVPQSVKNSYEEAKKVQKASPTAFAVMIRRALEFLCEDQKAEGKTLQTMLKNLSDKGIVPKTLADMTDVLRTLGNMGAHASEKIISYSEAEAIDDFYNAIVEYVYIGPYKLAKLRESIQNQKEKNVVSEDIPF